MQKLSPSATQTRKKKQKQTTKQTRTTGNKLMLAKFNHLLLPIRHPLCYSLSDPVKKKHHIPFALPYNI